MRLTAAKQIPAKVQKRTDTHQLGTPRILYEPANTSRVYLFIGPLAIIIGILIIGAYYLLYNETFSWWPIAQAYFVQLIGIAWLCVGLWVTLPAIIAPKTRIFLCPKGLVYRKRQMTVIRWDAIDEFWRTISLDRRTGTTCTYVIRRNDGKVFDLKPDLPYVDRLAGFIEREVTRQLLPRTIAAYNNGAALDFADIRVTSTGITTQHDHNHLVWAAIASISTDETTLSIRRKNDTWDWATLSISGIPNVGVLKGLVTHIIDKPVLAPQILAYDAGFPVFLGSLLISKTGVSINSSEELLPWSEIASFGIGASEVIIRRKGQVREWHTLPLWMISDIAALKTLLDHILYEQEFNDADL